MTILDCSLFEKLGSDRVYSDHIVTKTDFVRYSIIYYKLSLVFCPPLCSGCQENSRKHSNYIWQEQVSQSVGNP